MSKQDDLDRLVAAAKAWRDYQDRDSIIDQKTDVRLRCDAENARQDLLTAVDGLENEYDENPGSRCGADCGYCGRCT